MGLDVRIESMYKSHSTLALVSIPIRGWDQIRDDDAYQFVAFINSHDLFRKDEKTLAWVCKLIKFIVTTTSTY